jgi:phosphate starvation-inducible PhoH-like protein
MNSLHTILYFFFLLCLNNSCLLLTCKYVKRMNLMMKKTKNVDNTYIYTPKSFNQENYVESLLDDKVDMIIAVGPAGTGKTLFACLKAVSQLKNGNIRKLILTRPVVTVEEDIGFLPGNINKKMDPWTKPIFDLFLEFFTKTELDNFIHNNIIEISPLAFMRGRTFKNSFIIADEMQNSSPNQMKMLTTRIGTNSKMVITGDLNQTDIPSKNGLEDLIERINKYNFKNNNTLNSSIKIINFEKEDIERSDIVKHIINLYETDDKVVNNKNNIKTNVTILHNRNDTTVMNDTTNITNTAHLNTNAIKLKHYNDNDAALIPKHHMTKNTDIFYDNSNF